MGKTIFITGASSGLGKAAAKYFAVQGWNVAATMRTPANENELSAFVNIKILKLDVTDMLQVRDAIHASVKAFGKVDVVLNNAGVGMYGALELMDDEDIDRQFAVNVKGVINVIKGILPHFRDNGGGMFINISSVMGLSAALPLGSLYNMSKFALEGLIEGLYFEMKHLHIQLKLIEPGGFDSSFKSNVVLPKSNHIKVYDGLTKKMEQLLATPGRVANKNTLPEIVELIFKLAIGKKKGFRNVVGIDAKGIVLLRRLMPINWFLSFLEKYYKLDNIKINY
jgi:NAD(P)-dependent dehydrogenase (short-subunit alcohol dehydrogenase family)